MIILAAIGSLLGGAAVAGAVHVTVLTLPAVMAWFRARRAVFLDRDLVAATIVDLMASGSYRTVQGVFNTRTNHWAEYRTIESDRLGWDLAQTHRTARVVIHRL
ncbi:hypothetical protein [Nonomuraea sp. NPDC050783]|uniref:hypothetical protein n=1 Tax=Nonomuraea sp. NPDC050783 TaxID=3154634 RepID=UPI003466845F